MVKARDVDIIITNSYRPAWTERALESIRVYYPNNTLFVVDDCCVDCAADLEKFNQKFFAEILQSPNRRGAGRALDRGMRAATAKWVLTVDHGVTLTRAGVIEHLLERLEPDVAAVGKKLHNQRGEQYLGPAVYCDLALWDREFIVENDLSFKLTTLVFPDGSTFWGCTTARYLCWNLRRLGKEMRFINLAAYHYHEHSRDGFGRKFPSPHEEVDFDPDATV